MRLDSRIVPLPWRRRARRLGARPSLASLAIVSCLLFFLLLPSATDAAGDPYVASISWRIRVVRAGNLDRFADLFDLPEPYVKVYRSTCPSTSNLLGTSSYRSNTDSPTWNYDLPVQSSTSPALPTLCLAFYDDDGGSTADDFMGRASIPGLEFSSTPSTAYGSVSSLGTSYIQYFNSPYSSSYVIFSFQVYATLCNQGSEVVGSWCRICPRGRYAKMQAGTTIWTCDGECPAGSYGTAVGATASTQCTLCGTGKYSSTTAASSSAQCLNCPPGRYGDTEGLSTNGCTGPCVAGRYGQTGGHITRQCQDACPAGKYTTGDGLVSVLQCLNCAGGKYSENLGATTEATCLNCDAGKYSTTEGAVDESTCENCPGGESSPEGSRSCSSCPNGQYAKGGVCEMCPRGFYCESGGIIACTRGTFNPDEGQSTAGSCQPCAKGKHGIENGASSPNLCAACPQGRWSSQLGAQDLSSCVHCAPGKFQESIAADTETACQRCGPGSYQPNEGAVRCVLCAPGKHGADLAPNEFPALEQASCAACPRGTYSVAEGAVSNASCTPCVSGKFSSQNGRRTASDCQDCMSGKYSLIVSATSSAQCAECPRGKFQPAEGKTGCENCPSGKYGAGASSSGAGSGSGGAQQQQQQQQPSLRIEESSSCTTCPNGTFSGAVGVVDVDGCTRCPAGRTGKAEGLSSSQQCTPVDKGSYDDGGPETSKLCQKGTYQDEVGQTSCKPCGQGTYSSSLGATSNATCKNCPAGKWSGGVGIMSSSDCIECEPGKFGGNLTGKIQKEQCQNCPKGRYNDEYGGGSLVACKECVEDGTFCGEGSRKPTVCLANEYCTGSYRTLRPPKPIAVKMVLGRAPWFDRGQLSWSLPSGTASASSSSSSSSNGTTKMRAFASATKDNDQAENAVYVAEFSTGEQTSANLTSLPVGMDLYFRVQIVVKSENAASGKIYGIASGASDRVRLECPPGSDCDNVWSEGVPLSAVRPQPGFYRAINDAQISSRKISLGVFNHTFIPCKTTVNDWSLYCQEHASTPFPAANANASSLASIIGDEPCSGERTGFLCSKCRKSTNWEKSYGVGIDPTAECKQCPPTGHNLLFLAIFAVAAVAAVLYILHRKAKKNKASLTRIILTFAQFQSYWIYVKTPWPDRVLTLFALQDAVSGAAPQIASYDCLVFHLVQGLSSAPAPGEETLTDSFLQVIVFPLVLYSMVAAYYGWRAFSFWFFHLDMGRKMSADPKKSLVRIFAEGIRTLIVLEWLIFGTVLKKTFQLQRCTPIENPLDPKGPPIALRLEADMDVECYSDLHNKYLASTFWPSLVFHVVGFVFVVSYGLYYFHSTRFDDPLTRDKERDRFYETGWGYLVAGYRRDCEYWELTVLLRRVLVVIVLVFLDRYPLAQITFAISIISFFIYLHLYLRPYDLEISIQSDGADDDDEVVEPRGEQEEDKANLRNRSSTTNSSHQSIQRILSRREERYKEIIERGKSVNALEMTSLVVMFLTLISAMLLNERFLDEAKAEKLLGSESEEAALGMFLGMPIFGSDIIGTFVLIINGIFLCYFMSVYVTNYSKKFHRKTLGFARFVEKRLSEFSDAWSNGSGGSPAGSLSGASVPRALRGGGAKGAATRKTPLDKLKRRAAGVDLEMTKIDSLREEGSGKMVFTTNPNREVFKKMEKEREEKKKRASATSTDHGWKGVVARGSALRDESEGVAKEAKEDDEFGAKAGGAWSEHLDEASGKFYVYNLETGETKWKN